MNTYILRNTKIQNNFLGTDEAELLRQKSELRKRKTVFYLLLFGTPAFSYFACDPSFKAYIIPVFVGYSLARIISNSYLFNTVVEDENLHTLQNKFCRDVYYFNGFVGLSSNQYFAFQQNPSIHEGYIKLQQHNYK